MTEEQLWDFVDGYYRDPAMSPELEIEYFTAYKTLVSSRSMSMDEINEAMHLFAYFCYDTGRFSLAEKYFQLLGGMNCEFTVDALTQLAFLWYYGHTEGVDYQLAWDYAALASRENDKDNPRLIKPIPSGKLITQHVDLRNEWIKMALTRKGYGYDMTGDEYVELLLALLNRSWSHFMELSRFEEDPRKRANDIPIPEFSLLAADYWKEAEPDADNRRLHNALKKAKAVLSDRLLTSRDPDDIILMHALTDEDPAAVSTCPDSFYDLFKINSECEAIFTFRGERYTVSFFVPNKANAFEIGENEQADRLIIRFNNDTFYSSDDFFQRASFGELRCHLVADEIRDIRVIK
ncbi:MAG: hypothetical protein ACOYJO_03925 [Eubacterium sp.]|jgi:hypothetical protein